MLIIEDDSIWLQLLCFKVIFHFILLLFTHLTRRKSNSLLWCLIWYGRLITIPFISFYLSTLCFDHYLKLCWNVVRLFSCQYLRAVIENGIRKQVTNLLIKDVKKYFIVCAKIIFLASISFRWIFLIIYI